MPFWSQKKNTYPHIALATRHMRPNLTTGSESPQVFPGLDSCDGVPYSWPIGGGGSNTTPPENEGISPALPVRFSPPAFLPDEGMQAGPEKTEQQEALMADSSPSGVSLGLGVHIMRGLEPVLALESTGYAHAVQLARTLRRCPEWQGYNVLIFPRSSDFFYLPLPGGAA